MRANSQQHAERRRASASCFPNNKNLPKCVLRGRFPHILDSRDRLAQQLPDPVQIVRGTLLRRTICHARGCPKCRAGGGHPAWVLTVTYPGGKTRRFSIRPEQRAQVQKWVRNYQRLKEGLEAISELNHKLLRVLRQNSDRLWNQ